MSTTPVEIPLPAEYLPTGDHALIVAWTDGPAAVLCLEDGRSVVAEIGEFKFDYRYDLNRQRFVDVSGATIPEEEEEPDGDTDQEPPGDGSEGVSGRIPETDGAGEGDPGQPWDQGSGGLDASEGSG